MPHFIRNTSVALTWSSSGECRGIRLKRTGNSCQVVDFWAGKTDANHAATEIIDEGAKALNAKDAACCLCSGIANGWDAADVRLPKLPAAQLANALAFELRKHTPIPLDRLVWGYRLIAKATAHEQALYRLVFVKKDLWNKWCSIFSSTSPLDAIVPVPAILDPLCAKLTVTFPRSNQTADAYLPTPNGRTYKAASTLDANQQPIPLTELLAADFINLGKLADLPLTEQYDYADALLLAAYGLTDNATDDAETLIQLPDAMKPHHSAMLVISACVFIAIIIATLVLNLGMTLKSNLAQQRELKVHLADLERQINHQRASIKPERLKKIQELQAEVLSEIPNYPPLPLVLNSLSEIIYSDRETKPWIASRFTWNHEGNKLNFSVEEPLDDKGSKAFIEQPELIDELADCPYILDVRANSSTINRHENKCIREFTITLGWPDKAKRKEAAPRNAIRAAKRKKAMLAKEKKLREARERAKQAARDYDDQAEEITTEPPAGTKRVKPLENAPAMRGITAPLQPPPPPPKPNL